MEQTFNITLNKPAPPLNNLYGLRTRRNTLILNGERFKYDAVIKEIQREYKKYRNYENLKILNLLTA